MRDMKVCSRSAVRGRRRPYNNLFDLTHNFFVWCCVGPRDPSLSGSFIDYAAHLVAVDLKRDIFLCGDLG